MAYECSTTVKSDRPRHHLGHLETPSHVADPASPKKTRRFARAVVVLPLLAFAFYGVVIFCTAWLCDDAFISFRTADNFVHGYGLTWNVGERVQSYTHPLWLFLFSGVYALTREPYYTGLFLSMAVSLAAVGWYAWKIAKTRAGAVLGILAFACSVAFVDYSTSGMENPLTHLLLALFLGVFFCWEEDKASNTAEADENGGRKDGHGKGQCRNKQGRILEKVPCLLAFLTALAAVNRMDSVLFYCPALLYVLYRRRSWSCFRSMVVGLLPILFWMGFALFYYGFVFPNTAYAKLYNGMPLAALATRGGYYLLNTLRCDPITLVVIGGSFVCVFFQPRAKNICVALGMFFYLLFVVGVGGDFMSGRFLTAPYFVAVCLLGRRQWGVAKTWVPALATIVVLTCISSRPIALKRDVFDLPLAERLAKNAANLGISDECSYYYAGTGLLRSLKSPEVEFPNFTWVAKAKSTRAAAEKREDKTVIPTENIGIFGFYAGPRVHVADHFALTDAFLARLLPIADPQWRVGHFKRAFPDGYLATLKTGKNTLKSPGMAEYYDHLVTLTQGDLWSWDRIIAIWNMNLGKYEYLLKQEENVSSKTSVAQK